jgi:hypothetical protein
MCISNLLHIIYLELLFLKCLVKSQNSEPPCYALMQLSPPFPYFISLTSIILFNVFILNGFSVCASLMVSDEVSYLYIGTVQSILSV